jgi:TATA-box binding protein (TBP) (component of TFIID and TFIIIB)
MSYSIGRSSFLGHLNEVTSGLTSVREAGRLLESAEKDWPSLQARLEKMRSAIVKRGKMVVNLTGDKKMLETVLPAVHSFVDKLPEPAPSAGTVDKLLVIGELAEMMVWWR